MFDFLGRFVITHPWKICAGWLVAAILLFFIAPAWNTKAQDDDIRFLPDRCPSVRGYRLMEKAFPNEVCASQAVFAVERADRRLTPADFALVDQLVKELNRLRREEPDLGIVALHSYRDLGIGSKLTSADGRCTLIQAALEWPYLADQTRGTIERAESRLRPLMKHAGSRAPTLFTTGTAGIGRDMNKACRDSLDGTTLATIILVIVILLLVYRSPLLALVPLLTIAMSVVVSLKIMALATLIPGVHIVNITKVFAIVMLYGAGTDYCLFLISRYREDLEAGQDGAQAIQHSVGNVGGALTASAGTVICGLGLMVLAEFAKVRFGGPAVALGLGVALLASLTLAPALLYLFGDLVFWPRGVPHRTPRLAGAPEAPTFWTRISSGVVARPILVWSVAALVLLPLVFMGMRVKSSYRASGELPPKSSSLRGLEVIQRHFTAGEVGPVTVLVTSPTEWDSRQGQDTIKYLSFSLAAMPNVAEVRSLTQPLGKPLELRPPTQKKPSLLARLMQAARPGLDSMLVKTRAMAQKRYVARISGEKGRQSVTRVDVVLKSDPFSKASLKTLAEINTFLNEELPRGILPPGGVDAEVYGVTANARDLANVTEGDRVRINLLVLSGIFLILMLVVRKPWLAAYLLATVLFSYFATLGATALAGTIWSGRPVNQMDWRVPFFLFTILIAVGEDYNILLVTRALKERAKQGTTDGMKRALSRTGGTITSCGLIMAGTFATLMLAGLGTLKQIGFALAFGVLLDTFIVRTFLVPAFMMIVWKREKLPVAEGQPRARPVQFGLRRAG
jgi:RND superfamily putative drug exporter